MKPKSKFRRTKIVCTLGPATSGPEMIERLVQAGMDVARLNFSHGDLETHRQTIHAIRAVSGKLGQEVGILQDLPGPKIRLGNIPNGKKELRKGEKIELAPGDESQTQAIPVAYPGLLQDVEPGNLILLADGAVQLKALEAGSSTIVCEVLAGGTISSHKGVNLPQSRLRIKAFTEKDRAALALGLEEKVDFVALSFVREVEDLQPALDVLKDVKTPPLLIAKIEKPQAVNNFPEILKLVDGIMVARGDLGVEMDLAEVPIIQKQIIRMTRQAGKPVITATQMLTSMLENPRPTRAEASDAANAILDGTDALMLSDETAAGSYPIEAVATLDKIAHTTEPYLEEKPLLDEEASELLHTVAAGISRAACGLGLGGGACAIVASSSSGHTARLVARFRPPCPIIALTDRLETQRQLTLSWGVMPNLVGAFVDTDQMFESARIWAVEQGVACAGDCIVITSGVPVGVAGTTNLLKVMEIS